MVKINLDNFKNSDGSVFVYRPKVFFDNLCFEYTEKTVDEKLEILSELVINGLDLVSEIEKYMENRSPVTITSLKDTLAYYFLYLRGSIFYWIPWIRRIFRNPISCHAPRIIRSALQ